MTNQHRMVLRPEKIATPTGHILIVDDDEVMIRGVAELLRKRGLEVDTTGTLFGRASSGSYDIIIFDPLIEREGLPAAKEFVARLSSRRPQTSLIVVSEFIDDVAEVGIREGIFAVLHTKPVRVAALAECVRAILERCDGLRESAANELPRRR